MNKTQNKITSDAYREGYDRIFARTSDWTSGLTIPRINAIRQTARCLGKTPEEIASNYGLWKPELYAVN